jgi:hypothetical protein
MGHDTAKSGLVMEHPGTIRRLANALIGEIHFFHISGKQDQSGVAPLKCD